MLDKNIKHLRKIEGLSQVAYGRIFGASRSMIDSYERGNAQPGSEMLQAIAAHHGVTMEALLNRDLSKKSVYMNAVRITSTTDTDLIQAKDEMIAELRRQLKNQQEMLNNQQRIIEHLGTLTRK